MFDNGGDSNPERAKQPGGLFRSEYGEAERRTADAQSVYAIESLTAHHLNLNRLRAVFFVCTPSGAKFGFGEKDFDSHVLNRYAVKAAFELRRYLSWIEGLTTNQYVGGSNPSRRTTFL